MAIRRGDALVPVRAQMSRTLLAALLLNANKVVTVERLVSILWGTEPPVTAVASLHNHVMRLRAYLAKAGTGCIRAAAPGYLMEVPAGHLDVEVFTQLWHRAAQAKAAGNWDATASSLTAALDLWRGDPLEDVSSLVLGESEIPRLAQLYLDAQEARIDAHLQLSQYSEAITRLGALTTAHPLRERFHGQLMLACSRTGRRAEALAAYRRARRVLAEELGIEPGAPLQDLHQRILAADPTVCSADPGIWQIPGINIPVPAVRQLPPDTADFTGRDSQINLICGGLGGEPDETRPGAVIIAAVTGMAGVGKTALAVHAAHRLGARFPDGQLFASLQGVSGPLHPADVLARFLRDLGGLEAAIPSSEGERAARYRTLLAGRRMLIVLDDARDAAQVRPLLPGSAGCAVIVTSRRKLADLAGAMLVDLDVLPCAEAHALLSAIAGPQRAEAEPEAAAGLVACCGGLPLAIRIAAVRLASQPGLSIACLAAKLADERTRLAELSAGDLAVRATFADSYAALPTSGADSSRVFRLLGLPRMTVLGLPAIAALAGHPISDVAAALNSLTDTHMLDSPAVGRFCLHRLLRSYAAELAEGTDSQQERRAALRRMLRWYGDQAVTAARLLTPGCPLPPAAAHFPRLAHMCHPAQALEWFDTERPNLVTAARQAAELGLHSVAAQIAVAVWAFCEYGSSGGPRASGKRQDASCLNAPLPS